MPAIDENATIGRKSAAGARDVTLGRLLELNQERATT
jgi:hypothetical protein